MKFFGLFAAAAAATAASASVLPRQFSGTWSGSGTYYEVGLGACGISNNDSQFVVAVSTTIYDTYPGYTGGNPNNNPICGRQVSINYGGKAVTATIEDRCTGCAEFDLDMSPTLFQQFAAESVGRIPITWTWL